MGCRDGDHGDGRWGCNSRQEPGCQRPTRPTTKSDLPTLKPKPLTYGEGTSAIPGRSWSGDEAVGWKDTPDKSVGAIALVVVCETRAPVDSS